MMGSSSGWTVCCVCAGGGRRGGGGGEEKRSSRCTGPGLELGRWESAFSAVVLCVFSFDIFRCGWDVNGGAAVACQVSGCVTAPSWRSAFGGGAGMGPGGGGPATDTGTGRGAGAGEGVVCVNRGTSNRAGASCSSAIGGGGDGESGGLVHDSGSSITIAAGSST